MSNVVFRACTHPLDYLGLLHTHSLQLAVTHKLGNNCYTFDFTPATDVVWKAGQHGIFSIPNKNVAGKQWRVFSIASAPHEGFIRVATTIPPEPSSFKETLLSLTMGETVQMRGPIGEFHLGHKPTTIVGIAGGIGITPFRAFLAEFAAELHPDVTFELIYAGKDSFFAFIDLCQATEKLPNVTIHYVDTPEEVNTTLAALVATYHNQATYYISGSPGMIHAIRESLRAQQISNIINDPFKGY